MTRRQRRVRAAAAVLLTVLSALSPLSVGYAIGAAEEPRLLAVQLNGQTVSDGEEVTIAADGAVAIPVTLAKQLRLRELPAHGDDQMIRLQGIHGLTAKVDEQTQTLELTVDSAAFERTTVGGGTERLPHDKAADPGLFVNYDLVEQQTGRIENHAGLFNIGGFIAPGIVSTDFAASNQRTVRLQSHISLDDMVGGKGLLLGDGTLTGGAVGQSFPFGGVQFSSRSSDDRSWRRQPTQSILGEAAVPSTVDVFVNGALQSRQSVPAGPFTLENLPTVNGAGDVRVVVHDVLGQEQVITRSFYSSPMILPKGTSEYSVEAGALRRNYGTTSFDYGEAFFAGTHRYGLTSWLSSELHAEASGLRQEVGGQASFAIPVLKTSVRAGGAVSQHRGKTGKLLVGGIETTQGRFTAGISSEISGVRFTQLGYEDSRTLRESSQARLGLDLGRVGSVSASFLRLRVGDAPTSNVVSLGYGVNLLGGYFNISVFKNLHGPVSGGAFNFTLPFGDGASATTGASKSRGAGTQDQPQLTARLDQPAAPDGGFGYHLAVDNGNFDRQEAGATYRGRYADIGADLGRSNGTPAARLTASGTVGMIDGTFFAARHTDGAMALVETGASDKVRVYADRQLVGTTGSDGRLLIPRLRPNEMNRISIDPADVPLDVALTKTDADIVPRWGTGYVVRFPLQTSSSAAATLVAADQLAVAIGTAVRDQRTQKTTVVGHDGAVFVEDAADGDELLVGDPEGTHCTARLSFGTQPASQIRQELGNLPCQ